MKKTLLFSFLSYPSCQKGARHPSTTSQAKIAPETEKQAILMHHTDYHTHTD